MSPDDVDRIQDSFRRIEVVRRRAAVQFYDRLFALDPSLRALFSGDMGAQGEKIMETMSLAVRALDNPYAMTPSLQRLGVRHRRLGVRDGHYDTMQDAFLWMLEQNLGDAFTPEMRESWTMLYRWVAHEMKHGAEVLDKEVRLPEAVD